MSSMISKQVQNHVKSLKVIIPQGKHFITANSSSLELLDSSRSRSPKGTPTNPTSLAAAVSSGLGTCRCPLDVCPSLYCFGGGKVVGNAKSPSRGWRKFPQGEGGCVPRLHCVLCNLYLILDLRGSCIGQAPLNCEGVHKTHIPYNSFCNDTSTSGKCQGSYFSNSHCGTLMASIFYLLVSSSSVRPAWTPPICSCRVATPCSFLLSSINTCGPATR